MISQAHVGAYINVVVLPYDFIFFIIYNAISPLKIPYSVCLRRFKKEAVICPLPLCYFYVIV